MYPQLVASIHILKNILLSKDLSAHIDELKGDGAVKFTAEYESIEPGQQFTWDNSSMDVNKPKNRSVLTHLNTLFLILCCIALAACAILLSRSLTKIPIR
jgi:hypothetical protein